MHVCFCYNINDKKLKEFIKGKSTTVRELQKACNVGKGCGNCLTHVKEILESATQDAHQDEGT